MNVFESARKNIKSGLNTTKKIDESQNTIFNVARQNIDAMDQANKARIAETSKIKHESSTSKANDLATTTSKAKQRKKNIEDAHKKGMSARDAVEVSTKGTGTVVGNTVKGAGLQYVGAMKSAGGTLGQQGAGNTTNGRTRERNTRRTDRMTTDQFKQKQQADQEYMQARKQGQTEAIERGKQTALEADALINKGSSYIEKAKAGTNTKAGKFAVDVASQGAQMGADVVLGIASGGSALLPMALRSFGSGASDARQRGADENQQFAYGLLTGAVEVLTEKIFSAGIMQKLTGNAIFQDAEHKIASNIATSNIVSKFLRGSQIGEEIVYNLTKMGLAINEEGLEEVVSDILQPLYDQAILGTYDSYDDFMANTYGSMNFWKQAGYDYLVAGATTGLLGGVTGVKTTKAGIETGKAMKEDPEILNKNLSRASVQNEGSQAKAFASDLQKQQESGKNILGSQLRDLSQMTYEEQIQNSKALEEEKAKENEKIAGDTTRFHQNADIETRRAINKKTSESVVAQEDQIDKKLAEKSNQGVELSVDSTEKRAIAHVLTGTATSFEVDTILSNSDAKQVLSEMIGEEIPTSNESARSKINSVVSINGAMNRSEITKGAKEIVTQNRVAGRATLKSEGKKILNNLYKSGTFEKSQKGELEEVFARYYNAGEVGMSFNTVDQLVKDMGRDYIDLVDQNFSPETKMAIYQAGKADRASEDQKIASTVIKKTINTAKHKGGMVGALSKEDAIKAIDKYQGDGAKTYQLLEKLSKKIGVQVEIRETSSRENGSYSSDYNGEYFNGKIVIYADASNPLITVFKHELTHHLRQFATKEYNELRDYVVKKWYEDDPQKFDQAVQARIENYKKHGVDLNRDDAIEEIVADSSEAFFTDQGAIEDVISYSKSLGEKILEGIRSILDNMADLFAGDLKGYGWIYKDAETLKEAERLWMNALQASRENDVTAETTDSKYAIKLGMTDEERYQELKDKRIQLVKPNLDAVPFTDAELKKLEVLKKKEANKILRPVLEYLGIIKRGYKTPDVNISFNYSNGNFGESLQKETSTKDKDKFLSFAKMLTCFEDLANNAILIEKHNDKYKGTRRETTNFKQAYVLLSAMEDNGYIIPVKLLIKEYIGMDNVLYVTITLDKIKEDTGERNISTTVHGVSSDYSLADMLSSVNDKSMRDYIPKQFYKNVKSEGNSELSKTGAVFKSKKKFMLKDSVEKKGELIAVHNMNVEDLDKTLKLGGLPMPSIAIIKAEQGHEKYGDVSLVFDKNTIDPMFDTANEIYGDDAWTPTYPKIEYKVNDNVRKKIYDKIYSTLDRKSVTSLTHIRFDEDSIEDLLNSNDGDLFKKFEADPAVKLAYLKDIGKNVELQYSEGNLDGFHIFSNDEVKEFSKDFTLEELNEISNMSYEEKKEKLQRKTLTIRRNSLEKELETKDVPQKLKDSLIEQKLEKAKFSFDQMLYASQKYLSEGVPKVVNERNSIHAINHTEINIDDYHKWLNNLLDGLVEKEGIRNGKDPFTSSGDRRSWESLHWEATLENVVKEMKSRINGETILGHNFKPVVAKNYKSIEDVRKDSNRLNTIDDDTYDKLNTELYQRFDEIVETLGDTGKTYEGIEAWFHRDNARNSIIDSVRGVKTKAKLKQNLKKEADQYKQIVYNEDSANDLWDLIQDIQSMPTGYFEAKPRRAVGLEEIKAVVAPDDLDSGIAQAIKDSGAELVTYIKGDEKDRLKKLNNISNTKSLKFSIKDNEYMQAVNAGDMAKAQKMVDEEAKKAGFNQEAYHGTGNGGFTIFNTSVEDNKNNLGSHFGDYDTAMGFFDGTYGGGGDNQQLYHVYLKMQNPYETYDWFGQDDYYPADIARQLAEEIDSPEAYEILDRIKGITDGIRNVIENPDLLEEGYISFEIETDDWSVIDRKKKILYNGIRDLLKLAGYDSLAYENDLEGNGENSFVVLGPEQIKSADPITYDDQGNVIPLSERFKNTNPDIRYSMKDSEGNDLTEAQAEYFKNSQVRDENGNLLLVYHGTQERAFTIFRPNKVRAESGFSWATPLYDLADAFAGGDEARFYDEVYGSVIEGYLNITNMLDIGEITTEDPNAFERVGKLVGMSVQELEDLTSLYMLWEATGSKTFMDRVVALGYDGVTATEEGNRTYGFVNSNQFKESTNLNPTKRKSIRYSLKPVEPVQPTSSKWKRGWNFAEVKQAHPTLFELTSDDNEDKNPTSIGTTVSTYRKIYDLLESEGFNGTVLDASSGIGKGTEAGRKEYGFNVDDIEPFPPEYYKPKYKDYSKLNKKYDVVISNAVLNVLPQDERDNLIVKMGELTDIGGRIFVNVRGKDVTTNKSNVALDASNMEYFVESTGSYQKGFATQELVAYMQDALGSDFTVVPSNKFGAVSAIATRNKISYQLKDNPTEAKVSRMQERIDQLKKEFKRSDLKTPKERDVKIQASKLLKRYGASLTLQQEVVDSMTNIFKGYKATKVEWESLYQHAKNTAKDIVNSMQIYHDENWKDYQDLRGFLKKTPIKISDQMKGDIPDFQDWKKANAGTVKLMKDGRQIDELYQTLVEDYPQYFDPEITSDSDQLYKIVDVVDSLKPYYETLDAESMQDIVNDVAYDLMDTAYNLQAHKTFADVKYEEKQKALERAKAQRDKAVQREREKYNALEWKMAEQKFMSDQDIAKLKEKQKADKEKSKDRQLRSKLNNSIENNFNWLSEKLSAPSDKSHIPFGYSKAISDMLEGFDFSTDRTKESSKRMLRFASLQSMFQKTEQEGTMELDPDFIGMVGELSSRVDGKRLADISTEDLITIDKLMKAIKHQINFLNRSYSEFLKKQAEEYAKGIVWEANEQKRAKNYAGIRAKVNQFLNEANVKPADAFELMGGNMKLLYKGLRKGFDKHILNMKSAINTVQNTFKGADYKAWENEKHTFNIKDGGDITLTTTQLMSLYCLNRREQARQHILNNGITAQPLEIKNKGEKAQALDDNKVYPTSEEVDQMLSTLTQEQITICQQIQSYLSNEIADWGNETSLRIYGYKKFTEENYFPIKSDSRQLASNFDAQKNNQVAKPTILGHGSAKALNPNANNTIVIDDFAKVVTDHISWMSTYNALAPAIADFKRVFNMKIKDDQGRTGVTVKEAIASAYGNGMLNFIDTFVQDLNGSYGYNADTGLYEALLRSYKSSTIGINLRVLVQQPTAIVRSAIMINPKYLVKALNGKPAVKEMQEHCPIALWKSWGFYNMDVAPDMKYVVAGTQDLKENVIEKSMALYGMADNATWGYMWQAVKAEMEDTHPELAKGSKEYWEAVNDRFSEIIDRTQVVDSPFHRAQIMRNKDMFVKMATSFMAEPLTTYNMIRTELMIAQKERLAGQTAEANARVGRVVGTFLANAVTVSIASALVDAFRGAGGDDDEDKGKNYLKRVLSHSLSNLGENVNPLGLLPFAKDVLSLAQGYDISRMDMAGMAKLVKSVNTMISIVSGKSDRSYYYGIKQMVNGVSYVTGVPVGNIWRDLEGMIKTSIEIFGNGTQASFLYAKLNYSLTEDSNYRSKFADLYFKALDDGDTMLANKIKTYMTKHGVTAEYLKTRKRTYEKNKAEKK